MKRAHRAERRRRVRVWRRVALAGAAVAALTGAGVVPARAEPRPTPVVKKEKAKTVSKYVYDQLERAHHSLERERFDDVFLVLGRAEKRRGVSDYELALIYQTYGYAYSSQDDYPNAAESFEKCLAADGLPQGAAMNVRYNLAQLYVLLENYDRAVELFQEWFAQAENPRPSAYYMMSVAYTESGDLEKAIPLAKQAVEKAESPRESWLQLLLSLYYETKQYDEAVPVLETLTTLFPQKVYWLQLSAVYSELQKDQKALAAMELAYVQELLDGESELYRLAQLYLSNELPYEAAEVIEKGIEEKVIEADSAAWQLLGESWIQARERKRAPGPLTRAAELAENGDSFVRLAQLHIENAEWSKARKAIHAALAKGNLSNAGGAYLLLGIAEVNEARFEEGQRAFESAEKYEKTARAATQWLTHAERERVIHESLASAKE